MPVPSTILIVDDEPRGRETLEALLLPLGHRLEFAGSGAQTLEQAAACQPDLVLLDVMMPDMDGYEVCRRLRADPLLAEVPIILVTALDDRDSRLTGIEAGADDFITKPYDRMELRARVKTVLRLNRYRRITIERRRASQIAEQSADGFVVVDSTGILRYANRQARVYLGLPLDLMDNSLGSFQRAVDRHYQRKPDVGWNEWHDAKLQIGSARYLVRPENDTSEAFWLRVETLSNDPLDGEFLQLRDVSGEMKAQMQSLRFETFVAHKLRTPLTGLIGCLRMALDDLPADTSPDALEFLKISYDSAQRLENDINDVAEYVHARKTAAGLHRFPVRDIAPLLHSVATDLLLRNFRTETDPQLDMANVGLSSDQIGLIARELLENAVNFHPGRRPSVRAILAPKGTDRVSLQVMDDGVTLAPNQLLKAFSPYYQGSRFETGEQTGMGLGLSVVGAIVGNAGGQCHLVNRDPGPGVIAEIILPTSNA